MKNQFEVLQQWLPQILHTLKKEIKSEHFSKNPSFYRTYFGHRPQSRLTTEEILSSYEKELLQGNGDLGEWIVNRWVFNHGELYEHFAARLSAIHSDFSEIKQLTEEQSDQVLSGSAEAFGALPVYIFSVLNAVVFPETIFNRLREAAEKEERVKKEDLSAATEKETLQQMVDRHQREIARLRQKHEEKIAGVMRKYTTDINGLKKQIRSLQQRLVPQ